MLNSAPDRSVSMTSWCGALDLLICAIFTSWCGPFWPINLLAPLPWFGLDVSIFCVDIVLLTWYGWPWSNAAPLACCGPLDKMGAFWLDVALLTSWWRRSPLTWWGLIGPLCLANVGPLDPPYVVLLDQAKHCHCGPLDLLMWPSANLLLLLWV